MLAILKTLTNSGNISYSLTTLDKKYLSCYNKFIFESSTKTVTLVHIFKNSDDVKTLSKILPTFPIEIIKMISDMNDVTKTTDECDKNIFCYFQTIVENINRESIINLMTNYQVEIYKHSTNYTFLYLIHDVKTRYLVADGKFSKILYFDGIYKLTNLLKQIFHNRFSEFTIDKCLQFTKFSKRISENN